MFGLALGTVYGLIALGYTMVYGMLFMINFAHGEVFMIGAYVGWARADLADQRHRRPASDLGAAADAAAWRCRCRRARAWRWSASPTGRCTRAARPGSGPLISAVGASIFLQNAVMLTQGARMKVYMTNLLFPRSWCIQVGGVHISALVLVMVGVALAADVGAQLLVQRTTLGRCIRAVAEDREMAAVMGVNVGRVIALTFLLGSALGGAAGVLVGLYYTQIDFFMGYSAGLKAFTAAVLGGIGNIRGAMLGGLVLGVIESLAVTFINPAYKDVVAFAGADPGAGVPARPGCWARRCRDWNKV